MKNRIFAAILSFVAVAISGLSLAATRVPVAEATTADTMYIVVHKVGAINAGNIYHARHIYSKVFNGFAARLTPAQAYAVRHRSNVQAVFVDKTMTTESNCSLGCPRWAQDRINQRLPTPDSVFTEPTTGAGVTIYIFDTGVHITNADFGGRATTFFNSTGAGVPCGGHGTWTADIAAGTIYGVAPGATIKSAQIGLADTTGNCAYINVSDAIKALDLVVASTVRPAVVNMSFGGVDSTGTYTVLDSAVSKAVQAGVTVVISAGNFDVNAQYVYPARAPGAIVVGASTLCGPGQAVGYTGTQCSSVVSDNKTSFSDFGTKVHIWAPGKSIPGYWYYRLSNADSLVANSGTSASAPVVSGIVAMILQRYPKTTPHQIDSILVAESTPFTIKRLGSNAIAMSATDSAMLGDTLHLVYSRLKLFGDTLYAPKPINDTTAASPISNPVAPTPHAPTYFAAALVNRTSVRLRWSGELYADSLIITRNALAYKRLPATATFQVDNTTARLTNYRYTIRSKNALATSTDSATLLIRTQ